jgi:glutathione S-transferase
MITIHHLAASRSQRILWLLEELGLPYEVKRYERDPKTMLAPPELRAIHPLGKSPVITDGDKTIAETGAIVEYLIETYGHGKLIPAPGTPEKRRYTYWLHYAEGSAMPPMVMKLIFSRIPKAPELPFFIKPIARTLMKGVTESFLDPQIKNHVALWDAELQKSPYFAGDDLTGADILMSFPIEAAAARATLTPRLKGYLTTIHTRPAYQAALKTGGPYELLSP